MKKAKVKKHIKLYNRVWEALHAEDKFVVTSEMSHAEVVGYVTEGLVGWMESRASASPADLVEFVLDELKSLPR